MKTQNWARADVKTKDWASPHPPPPKPSHKQPAQEPELIFDPKTGVYTLEKAGPASLLFKWNPNTQPQPAWIKKYLPAPEPPRWHPWYQERGNY